MSCELVDANSLRDGGSTFVTLRMPTQSVVTYWFDYSLPWDGRVRHVRMTLGEHSSFLEPGGQDELSACNALRSVLVENFGESVVSRFESGDVENPGKERWYYAFNFLRLCIKEGKLGRRV